MRTKSIDKCNGSATTVVLAIVVAILVVVSLVGNRLWKPTPAVVLPTHVETQPTHRSTTYDLTTWEIVSVVCSPSRCMVGLSHDNLHRAVIVYDRATKTAESIMLFRGRITKTYPDLAGYVHISTRMVADGTIEQLYGNQTTHDVVLLYHDGNFTFTYAIVYEQQTDVVATTVPTYEQAGLK